MKNGDAVSKWFYTAREVAGILRISTKHLNVLVNQRKIPCVKLVGRILFPVDEFEKWLHAKNVATEQ